MTTIPNLLSDAELDALAEQVNYQLVDLSLASIDWRSSSATESESAPPQELPDAHEQRAELERITGIPFQTFWQHYLRHMTQELLPGGLLYEQWLKRHDLSIKDTVRVSYGTLKMMGCPAQSLTPVTVAATVYLLNMASTVGLDAICAEFAANEKKGQ